MLNMTYMIFFLATKNDSFGVFEILASERDEEKTFS